MSNIETVQSMYEAFGAGDFDALVEHLTEDVEWDREAPSYGVPIFEPGTGKEHARRFFEQVVTDLEFQRFEPANFLAGGDQVAVPINVEATVRATGKSVEVLEIHLWTFGDDGKVTRFFHSIDRQAFVLAYAGD